MSVDEPNLRLFVALPVPAEVRASLALIQREMKDLLPPGTVGWSRMENAHLTLRFLGTVAGARVESLTASLRQGLAGFGLLSLESRRLGCFPNLRHPRVIWAWVSNAENRLDQLRQRVVSATHGFTDLPPDERFIGHITIGRSKEIQRPVARLIAGWVENAVNRRFGDWTADRVQLIRSDLSPTGSNYTTLAEFFLAGNEGRNG